MTADNLFHIDTSELADGILLTDGDEMGRFGKAINNNPYAIIPVRSAWKFGNEVHRNVLPFPHGYLGLFEETRGTLMLGLNFGASKAF
jgi:hypothetical protein